MRSSTSIRVPKRRRSIWGAVVWLQPGAQGDARSPFRAVLCIERSPHLRHPLAHVLEAIAAAAFRLECKAPSIIFDDDSKTWVIECDVEISIASARVLDHVVQGLFH